jgi:hypothetical protein
MKWLPVREILANRQADEQLLFNRVRVTEHTREHLESVKGRVHADDSVVSSVSSRRGFFATSTIPEPTATSNTGQLDISACAQLRA